MAFFTSSAAPGGTNAYLLPPPPPDPRALLLQAQRTATALGDAAEAAGVTRKLAMESGLSQVATADCAVLEDGLRDVASQPDFPACAPKTTALLQHRSAGAFFDCNTVSFVDGSVVGVMWLGQLENALKTDHGRIAGLRGDERLMVSESPRLGNDRAFCPFHTSQKRF